MEASGIINSTNMEHSTAWKQTKRDWQKQTQVMEFLHVGKKRTLKWSSTGSRFKNLSCRRAQVSAHGYNAFCARSSASYKPKMQMLMDLVPWHHCALQKSISFGSVVFHIWRQSSGLRVILKMLFSDLHQQRLGFCKSKSNSSPTSYQIRCTKAGLSGQCFNSLFRNLSYSAFGDHRMLNSGLASQLLRKHKTWKFPYFSLIGYKMSK